MDENGILDVDEYLAAVFHLSTYLFCSAPGCGKVLDVLRESGEVCLECQVPFMLCQEVGVGSRESIFKTGLSRMHGIAHLVAKSGHTHLV